MSEASESFGCFGARCAIFAGGDRGVVAVAAARLRLLAWHERFTRFAPGSELSQLNADPREEVPVSPDMARFVAAVIGAAEQTDGLVDATLLDDIERAGYRTDLGAPLPLALALRLAPARRPARPNPESRSKEIEVDAETGTVRRPPGVRLDSGGLAKGLFADLLAGELRGCGSFALDCAGDLRVGGIPRAVNVASQFGPEVLHAYALADRGVATSGIGRRSWLDGY